MPEQVARIPFNHGPGTYQDTGRGVDDQAGARGPDNDRALRDQVPGRQVIRCSRRSPGNRRASPGQRAGGNVKRLVLRRTSNCRSGPC